MTFISLPKPHPSFSPSPLLVFSLRYSFPSSFHTFSQTFQTFRPFSDLRSFPSHSNIQITDSLTMATAGQELEPPSTDLITLTRHILSQQQALGEAASGDLTLLLIGIQVSCLVVAVHLVTTILPRNPSPTVSVRSSGAGGEEPAGRLLARAKPRSPRNTLLPMSEKRDSSTSSALPARPTSRERTRRSSMCCPTTLWSTPSEPPERSA